MGCNRGNIVRKLSIERISHIRESGRYNAQYLNTSARNHPAIFFLPHCSETLGALLLKRDWEGLRL
jgi:hypothetical protein